MYYGSFTVTVEAETEEERDQLMDNLAVAIETMQQNADLNLSGFEDTEDKWEDSDEVKVFGIEEDRKYA